MFVNLWGGRRGEPYWNVTDLLARLQARSGVVVATQMLRHTYAAELLRRDVPAEVVAKLLGPREYLDSAVSDGAGELVGDRGPVADVRR